MTNPDTIYLNQQLGTQIIVESATGEMEIFTANGTTISQNQSSNINVIDDTNDVNSDDVQLGFVLEPQIYNSGNHITTSSHLLIDGQAIYFDTVGGNSNKVTVGGFECWQTIADTNILVCSLPRDSSDMTAKFQFARNSGTNNLAYAGFKVYINGVFKQEFNNQQTSPTLSNGQWWDIDMSAVFNSVSYIHTQ
jgi:hypothetical protein